MNIRLPIGSVVLLTESTKKVMIMGFCQARPEEPDVIFDYCGCLYPEGFMDPDHIFLFDEEQIQQVFSVGYMDEEQFAFQKSLEEIRSRLIPDRK